MSVTWISTGLHWRDGVPVLTATDGRREHAREVGAGTQVSWRTHGPRRCTGVHLEGRYHPCPYQAVIDPAGKAVQCEPCQGADRGLALARDQILDDGRTYRLYLAWLGPGLLKVGITGEARGTARLLEQAALAFLFLARGSLPAVRRAELTVAQAGLARERFSSRAKTATWWELPDAARRAQDLAALRARAAALLADHAVELLPDVPATDHVARFGLTEGAPARYQAVTALTHGATLAGTLRTPVGRHLFLDTEGSAEPLLLDTRLLTGWPLALAPQGPCTGLELSLCLRPEAPPETLF